MITSVPTMQITMLRYPTANHRTECIEQDEETVTWRSIQLLFPETAKISSDSQESKCILILFWLCTVEIYEYAYAGVQINKSRWRAHK